MDEGTRQAMHFGNEVRAEALNIAYHVLTTRYGFSPKRVKRAILETLEMLATLDEDAIKAILEEGEEAA